MKYGDRTTQAKTVLDINNFDKAPRSARQHDKTTKKPFAAFDIDGTIIRWQLYHALVDRLVKDNKIDPNKFQDAKSARMVWKNRVSDQSFNQYQETLINIYEKAVSEINYDDFLTAANQVFDEYKGQVYTYTRDLIKQLKQADYLLFAISASQVEIVELLAKYYGFDDWAGSKHEVKNSSFTGRKEILSGSNKPKALEKLISKHSAHYGSSIAVGDSDSDIPMLEKVEQPIAFNPNKKLFQKAQANNWQIVVERKNMVYQLKAENDKYYLI